MYKLTIDKMEKGMTFKTIKTIYFKTFNEMDDYVKAHENEIEWWSWCTTKGKEDEH